MSKSIRKYYCEKCDYTTSITSNYNKHLLTLKHNIDTNNAFLAISGNIKNVKSIFYCEACNFQCNNKFNYDVHLLTEKHKNNCILVNEGEPKEIKHICSLCNKEYFNYNALWKHKKKCVVIPQTQQEELQNTFTPSSTPINTITTEMVVDIIKQSKELQNVLIEQNKELQNKLLELASKPQSVINNNTTNQQFNLQLYLNETCKDAMNIADFVNSLQLTTDDFETTGKLGFIDGISRIFIKELKKLDTEKLPIHCTDFKRETVYIKDNNTWEKENDEKKRVKWAIDRIAKLNYNQIQQWQEKFPECRENNTPANEYFFRLVKVALGGYGKEEEDKFREKIMKNVLKEVVLDKKAGKPRFPMRSLPS